MKTPNIFDKLRLIAVVIMIFKSTGGSVLAKNITFHRDITSEQFWRSNAIQVIKIIDQDDAHLTCLVIQTLSGTMPHDPTERIEKNKLWFRIAEERSEIYPNDFLVICRPEGGTFPIIAEKIQEKWRQTVLGEQLLKISELRNHGLGQDELVRALSQSDDMVVAYCVNTLAATSVIRPKPGLLQAVRRVRDANSRDCQVRLLAAELFFRIEGRPPNSDEKYTWLNRTIANSGKENLKNPEPLVNRLIDFGDRRVEIVDLLTGLVKNQKTPQAVRAAI